MSTFEDYKTYRRFAPQYQDWKQARDLAEAKRQSYLRQNPDEIKYEDIQRGKNLLRAIDIMDEYSQKRAEDMEVATETVVGWGFELASIVGGISGLFLGAMFSNNIKLSDYLKKSGADSTKIFIPFLIGSGIASSIAAFPLYNWAAKKEIHASRKGRFEAMRNELNNSKLFAVLTPEQENEVQNILNSMPPEKKSFFSTKKMKASWANVKNMLRDSDDYVFQKMQFDNRVQYDISQFERELSTEEVEKAEKDKQLLTKLVEKIDIASQDYAENAELATSTLTTAIFSATALLNIAYQKIAKAMKIKASVAPAIIGLVFSLGASIYSAQIQKEASRVGRYMVKKDLTEHPEKLAYIADEKTQNIENPEQELYKKPGMIKFLSDIWKDNQEYNKWKKNESKKEKQTAEAVSKLEISEEQLKDAQRLQHNTFKTFNKIDENSQKYSESIEALGQAAQTPIALLCSSVGAIFGLKHLNRAMSKQSEMASGLANYLLIVLLSSMPSLFINAYITKEQKKASRIADMLAIKELDDYRHFADYNA